MGDILCGAPSPPLYTKSRLRLQNECDTLLTEALCYLASCCLLWWLQLKHLVLRFQVLMNKTHTFVRELQLLERLFEPDGPDSRDPLLEVLIDEVYDLRVDAVVAVPLLVPVYAVHELVHRLGRDQDCAVLSSIFKPLDERREVALVRAHGIGDSVDGFLKVQRKWCRNALLDIGGVRGNQVSH